jgi:hypothetical protein
MRFPSALQTQQAQRQRQRYGAEKYGIGAPAILMQSPWRMLPTHQWRTLQQNQAWRGHDVAAGFTIWLEVVMMQFFKRPFGGSGNYPPRSRLQLFNMTDDDLYMIVSE